MTYKAYIAMATAVALALGAASPAFAEDAPKDEKADMATDSADTSTSDEKSGE